MGNDMSDLQLVERARGGDAVAFRALVERHQRKAFAVALGLLRHREDAMDVCQDAFLRAHRGLASFDGNAQFFTWLYRIIYNLCIDQLRRRRFEQVSIDDADARGELEAPTTSEDDPVRRVNREELRARLDAALQELSPAHRAVLVLREVQGLSYKEIADVVGCQIGTVMSRLFHARKNLEKALRADETLDLELAFAA
jgi:RNA polymerase sigma-70 factor (ECF subfamily)